MTADKRIDWSMRCELSTLTLNIKASVEVNYVR